MTTATAAGGLGLRLSPEAEALLGGDTHPDEVEPYPAEFFDLGALLPTDVGYADDAEAHDALAQECMRSPLYAVLLHGAHAGGVDWGKVPEREHPVPEVLHCGQDFVMPHVVEHYIRGGALASDSGEVISLMTVRGITFPTVGTHRMAAVMMQGLPTFVGRWVEVDEDGAWRERA